MTDAQRRGELIAEGRTALVYAWGDDRVVKVLRPGFPDALGMEEADAARLADEAGIGAPRFHGLVRVDGRVGLVYERREGSAMLERLTARPWELGRLAASLGRLHAAMHGVTAVSLPRLREAVVAAVRRAADVAGPEARDAALERIRRLPDGDALCHGDFHPGNVMLGASGPAVIDWLTAAAGPPAADVARTLMLLLDGQVPEAMPPWRRVLIGLLRRRYVAAYLRAYRAGRPLDPGEVAGWRLPILVARLDERIEPERAHLLGLIGQEMAAAGPRVPGRHASAKARQRD